MSPILSFVEDADTVDNPADVFRYETSISVNLLRRGAAGRVSSFSASGFS
jgi:hypothetical protein